MTTPSSILAWEVPWTEEPGGLQSMESQKSWTVLNNITLLPLRGLPTQLSTLISSLIFPD